MTALTMQSDFSESSSGKKTNPATVTATGYSRSSMNPLTLLADYPLVRVESPCLKDTKSGASATVAGKEFQTGMVRRKKLNL